MLRCWCCWALCACWLSGAVPQSSDVHGQLRERVARVSTQICDMWHGLYPQTQSVHPSHCACPQVSRSSAPMPKPSSSPNRANRSLRASQCQQSRSLAPEAQRCCPACYVVLWRWSGGAVTGGQGYGEITKQSNGKMIALIQSLSKLTVLSQLPTAEHAAWDLSRSSCFCDIGSGYGKVVFHAKARSPPCP